MRKRQTGIFFRTDELPSRLICKIIFLKLIFLSFFLLCSVLCAAQEQVNRNDNGIITGNLIDLDNSKAIPAATVEISRMDSISYSRTALTVNDGAFLFEQLPYGIYRLKFSASGYAPLTMDSINLRADRFDFDLNEIKLSRKTGALQEVVIYVEKPLIENKDGKITFNVGESALAAGASTTELLKQTPLVSLDADGKVMLKGKDVKILIDDKPVELNAKQLQDLLESMPGSMVDKIEVMTTPPPQYANERGGVINIVTKKGKVGMNARINLNYGTRGETTVTGNFGFRKNKFALNFNAGYGYNEYEGSSNSARQNLYTDSINFFNTNASNASNNRRPNVRLSMDYDLNKTNAFNFTAYYNANDAGSGNATEYVNRNRFSTVYRLSNRFVDNKTNTDNPNVNITYTNKNKDASSVLKLIGGFNYFKSVVNKDFYQEFLDPVQYQTLSDSSQVQETTNHGRTFSFRVNYDRQLKKDKWWLNTGGYYSGSRNHNVLNTEFLKKPEMIFIDNPLLSNDFVYHIDIISARLALKYNFDPNFYINAGFQQEHTVTDFTLTKASGDFRNEYWSTLPFVNVIKKWEKDINLTFSYKRTVQRPGLTEMNPSIDYSDPYNTRFGNPYLAPYYADNFDLTAGKWTKLYNINFSVGFNELKNIYSSIRTLLPDGKTELTWQNISGRKEYEASIWGGYTLSAKSKANLSIGYTYNEYSAHDRTVRKFKNGGSIFSTLNSSYQFSDLFNASGSFTFNRFANPQGSIRSTLSMNVGVQRKFFRKKIILSINAIDPFKQLQNKTITSGTNFNLESYSSTKTRNFRFSISYVFNKKAKKKSTKAQAKTPVKTAKPVVNATK